MKNIKIYNQSFISNKINTKKRNISFDYTLQQKKNLMKRLKHKIFKNKNKKSKINLNNSINDEIENKDNKGYAFYPNSFFILIFDLLLIISVLYTFVEIPLNVAKNKKIGEEGSIIKEIIHYIIDLIFFLDMIICFFRGYYNNEMDIIINNKKIFFNYIKNNFLFDLFEGIPLYTIIKIFMKQNKTIYSQIETLSITFLLLIKPLKVFKIIKRKNNKVLEKIFMLFNDNYSLERLIKFLIYFFIFFLFINLFICLHIYLTLRSYPNWLIHIDIMNENFLTKYLS